MYWYNKLMLTLSQMLVRLVVAILVGAIIGVERESTRKEAGVKTSIMVSAGAAIFTMIGLMLPYVISGDGDIGEILARNSGFLTVIANIVVGIGFLGAGIILKTERRVHGLTTAAVIWVAAAIGVLAGLGLYAFAFSSTLILSGLIYLLRKIDIEEKIKDNSSP